MSEIVLYSTGCPKCKVLEAKLQQSGLSFTVCSDENLMVEKGFMSAPVLQVGDTYYEFPAAVKYVNEVLA